MAIQRTIDQAAPAQPLPIDQDRTSSSPDELAPAAHCDRCDGPLDGSPYRLQRDDPNASETHWIVCHSCIGEFNQWLDGEF